MPLRVAFFGTPAFALPTLERLQASPHDLALVITQPDKPRGRGQKIAPSPVKAFATSNGLHVLQPERLRDDAFMAAMETYRLDLAVVAAYGKILPQRLLDLPRLGTINVHASLLPRWRGAAPVHRSILAGDLETGVTIMRVVAALDAGPMIASARVTIGVNETSAELETRLAHVGADLLVTTMDDLAVRRLREEPQSDAGVTYASRLERGESHVDWARPAVAIHNQIRGLQPWPLAAVVVGGRRLLLLGSEVAHDRPIDVAPGTIAAVEPGAFLVAASPGAVRITHVKLEGRAPMPVRDFLNGYRLAVGARLAPALLGR